MQSTKTLGCFQIESPGQRELVGKFAPETFEDLIIDISLFRPGPVKSDMVRPFLESRQGWAPPDYPHPDLAEHLEQTCGVVVFHEQVLQIVATMTGCSLAEADEVRRALGDPEGQPEVRVWFVPTALGRGYDIAVVERVWEVLKAFGSFGFCKAHAAAFALPTYQSAWLKAHHPAAFLAGVLTHDPGMYPKRLILDDARQFGIAVLGLDVNASAAGYAVERVGRARRAAAGDPGPGARVADAPPRPRPPDLRLPDGRGYGIRIGLDDVKGINAGGGRPDRRRPALRLAVGLLAPRLGVPAGRGAAGRRRAPSTACTAWARPSRAAAAGQVTRRDLLLQVAELDRWSRSTAAAQRKVSRGRRRPVAAGAAAGELLALDDVRGRQARQSQAAGRAGARRRAARARPRRRPRADDRRAGCRR